ncbi:MAG: FAD:protein FMN transferase, partial [Kiloniellales bacterium]|nr:FAD:protein FMN transferase [Kiloniellales bacterium]
MSVNPNRDGLSRRRFLSITAAVGGSMLAGGAPGFADSNMPGARQWQGTALGARANMTLYHPDAKAARAAIAQARAEIERLERIFSLYRAGSALSRLNRDGVLTAPPLELVQLLSQAETISVLTDGAFDVTVQPLWRLYAEHFAQADADPDGPNDAVLAATLGLVDHRALRIDSDRIAFGKPRMAVTLNGIAQGYITDRVALLLRAAGFERVLIDLGEIRALGRHPDGRPWTAGIADPEARDELLQTLALEDRALATSAAAGLRFEPSGRHHHLFDPRTGRGVQQHISVSVVAPSATLADGLSTGFSGMSVEAIEQVCNALPKVSVIVLAGDGRLRSLG